jgi:LPXTG-motif cell wall-anchored protein
VAWIGNGRGEQVPMQNPTTMTAILLILAGALLVLYLLRRRKRKSLEQK